MHIAKHHAEWLSLTEISGPFLSMPVLLHTFPQGLDAVDPALAQTLRAAYEEWADNQGGLTPDPAIHTAWIRFVLRDVLEFPDETLAEGQAIPESIKATLAEHGETIRPDLMVVDPDTGQPQLLIQTYPAGQELHKTVHGRSWKASPATRMMELLHRAEIPLGLISNGEHWLLVAAKSGETTGYAGWYASLWLEERLTLRAFRTLLGVARFFGVPEGQTLPALLTASAKDQHEVTDQLGYQVRRAVEILVQAIDRADQDRGRTLLVGVGEAELYEAALTVMMRLVFLLTAEERGLLLLGEPIYDQHYAISTLRAQLRELADQQGEDVLERRFDAWSRLLATFRAVYGGVWHEDLRLPAYGGSLFDPDRFPFLEGRRASRGAGAQGSDRWLVETADPLPINNRATLHLLDALQLLQVKGPGGEYAARRLSFRALDIEQIGHVYEGLLDHEARRATEPVLGLQGAKGKEPEIPLSRLEEFLVQRDKGAKEQSGDAFDPALREKLLDFLQEETGRSRSALNNALNQSAIRNSQSEISLRIACGNDDALYRRALPWAGLLRQDDFGYPVVIPAGSVYVTAGTTRRATGTHYTPRSLTEPIVQHTLEPLVYVGPAEGEPREAWQLRSPQALLDLKVCDMAMGSGAFLVQACRYLSERLVEAWENVAGEQGSRGAGENRQSSIVNGQLSTTPEGRPATGDPQETIIPEGDEERLTLARRLVAERCLYGVDKNPLAVEMAKLSLWLVTLSKSKPFTFLNHALRHGDSLIGAEEDGYNRWWHSLKGTVGPLYAEENEKALHEARRLRRELQTMPVLDAADAQRKAELLAAAERATAKIQRACDLLVGVQLLGLSQTERETWRQKLLIEHVGSEIMDSPEANQALAAARQHDAFHWFVEFPEVFAQGGFSAFVGNPPFQGSQKIRGELGNSYREYIVKNIAADQRGQADLCSYFFLRAVSAIKLKGVLGLIATNTISQGDTRVVGLDQILANGWFVIRAITNQKWPGVAAVEVNLLWLVKHDDWKGRFFLNNQQVAGIDSSLTVKKSIAGIPNELATNSNLSFIGSYVLGMGFVLTPEEAGNLIEKSGKNRDVILPYLNGADVTSHPEQTPSRMVINFFDWPLRQDEDKTTVSPCASNYPDCLDIIKNKVKPERDTNNRKSYKVYWWHYAEKRTTLYQTIKPLTRVLVTARIAKHVAFVFVPKGWVYNEKTVVIAFDTYSYFAVLQSNIHEAWAWQWSSTMRNAGISYAPSSCFTTFPFPLENMISKFSMEKVAEFYYEHRRQLMLNRQEGLTATYNRFHDPAETAEDIAHLRRLHLEMDQAVAAAYGWSDLALDHGFHETAQGVRYTISEPARREVLTRLLQLNHQRYEEEVKLGLHEKKQGSRGAGGQGRKAARKGRKKDDGQLSMF